jgi:putative ABC transport system permease protein
MGAAVTIAVGSGLLFGILPASRAARLDPVQALAGR